MPVKELKCCQEVLMVEELLYVNLVLDFRGLSFESLKCSRCIQDMIICIGPFHLI